MKKTFYGLLFLVTVLMVDASAQDNRKLDSLRALINSPADTLKVGGYTGMGILYIQKQPPLARENALKALALSKKINYAKGIADANNVMGGYFMFSGKFDSAAYYNQLAIDYYLGVRAYKKLSSLFHSRGRVLIAGGKFQDAKEAFLSALSYNKRLRDTGQMANNYASIADISTNLGQFDEAVANHIQAQKLYTAIHDAWGEVVCLNNIASVYRFQKQYDKAIANYNKVYEQCKALNRPDGVITALDNIGATYLEKRDLANGEKYLLQAYSLLKKNPDPRGVSLITVHVAVMYHYKNDYKNAEKYYLEAMKLYETQGDVVGLTSVYTNLGALYQELGKYRESVELLLKSIDICKMQGTTPSLIENYQNLALTYSKMKNFEKAYEYSNLCEKLKDSLYVDETNEKISEMEAKYQNDKKQKEIALKNSELSKKETEIREQNLQKLLFAGGAGALFILGLLLYRGNAVKKKANQELVLQKREISEQKTIIEEKNKDITDSIKYAKHIQDAILPAKQLVNDLFAQSFVLFEPKDIVSGDFYWVEKRDHISLFAVADCTGHGVPGALISVVCSNALGKAVNENKLVKPSEILDNINRSINNTLRQKQSDSTIRDGMDIALCAYDPFTKQMEFAGANNPLYILRNGELIITKGDKQPVGSYLEEIAKPFTNHSFQLQKNDLVFVFSDGFADQFGGEHGKKLKYSQMQQMFLKFNQMPMPEMKQSLHAAFTEWKGDNQQVDDVCIMGIRIV